MAKSARGESYPEIQSYSLRDPYAFMDIVKAMNRSVSWRYSSEGIIFDKGVSNPEEVIEDHFKELEHATHSYFEEYRIEAGDDNVILLEKEYDRNITDHSASVGNIDDELIFRVIGEVEDDIDIDNMISWFD